MLYTVCGELASEFRQKNDRSERFRSSSQAHLGCLPARRSMAVFLNPRFGVFFLSVHFSTIPTLTTGELASSRYIRSALQRVAGMMNAVRLCLAHCSRHQGVTPSASFKQVVLTNGDRGMYTAVMPQNVLQEKHVGMKASVDPFGLVEREVQIVSERLRHSVVSNIPALKTAAEYFFRPGVEGKRLRPTLAMLMASALSPDAPTGNLLEVDLRPASEPALELRRRTQRLAEISELIHVASLLHDDVLDDAETRRGVSSLNLSVGNKMAILAGDFLLARASVTLAALRETQVVELMSQVLENLVTGEIMQMTATEEQLLDQNFYLEKTYCKTASLMANSSKSIAVLSGQTPLVCSIAEGYGRHLGLAFQIIDDVLDLTASSTLLGKPALNDIKSGIATAPVLLAAEEYPELKALILRRFKGSGDLNQAVNLIGRSQGIQRAREMAQHHCFQAAELIRSLPETESGHSAICRAALIEITGKVLNRKK